MRASLLEPGSLSEFGMTQTQNTSNEKVHCARLPMHLYLDPGFCTEGHRDHAANAKARGAQQSYNRKLGFFFYHCDYDSIANLTRDSCRLVLLLWY